MTARRPCTVTPRLARSVTTDDLVLVTGAGGFIGGHLVAELLQQRGHTQIRAVDVKPLDEWYQRFGRREADASISPRRGVPRGRRQGAATSTTSPPTWAAWASSRPTRPSACCRC